MVLGTFFIVMYTCVLKFTYPIYLAYSQKFQKKSYTRHMPLNTLTQDSPRMCVVWFYLTIWYQRLVFTRQYMWYIPSLMRFFLYCMTKLEGLQRCGKSCRLRWINYLRPDLKRGTFSQEEENLIIELHAVLGNKYYFSIY